MSLTSVFVEENERESALSEALEQQLRLRMKAGRTWPMLAGTLLLGGLLCVLVSLESLHWLLGVPLSVMAPAMVIFAALTTVATVVFPRYDALHPTNMWLLKVEIVAAMGVSVTAIYASGSAGSVFWLLMLTQLANIAHLLILRGFARWLFVCGFGVLGLLFLISGKWPDVLLVIFFGGLGIWVLENMLAGRFAILEAGVERALLERRLRQGLLEEERARIARDLHDGIGAELTSLIFQTRSLKAKANVDGQQEQIDRIVGQARENLDELRNIVWSLSSANTDWDGFVARVRTKIESLCGDELELEFKDAGCPPGFEVPAEWSIPLLRITQEAVRNTVQHSQASRVVLHLGVDEDGLDLAVVDDGRGLSRCAIASSKGGLANLQARALSLGGSLLIEDATPGTRITLRLPL